MFWTFPRMFFPFARKGLNMRAAWLGARAAHRRQHSYAVERSAARHFSLPRSKVYFPVEDFYGYGYQPLYTTVDGGLTEPRQAVVPVIRNPVNRNIQIATVPSVHEYFDRPAPLVSVCVRRAIRREVLFAKKLTVKGSKQSNHTWSKTSLVRCMWHGNQLIPPQVETRL